MSDLSAKVKTAFQGRRIEVRLVDVPTGDGRTARRELVVHPGAAVVLAVTDDGDVVMIRNTRFAVDRELWELPAGTLEPPEPPDRCALRELREETGYQAATIEPLGVFYTSPGFCNEQMHAFVARGLTHVGQATEPGEQIRVTTVAPERLRAMMLSGEIADGKTIAALALYLLGRHA